MRSTSNNQAKGAEYYSHSSVFHRDNNGCKDWTIDHSYGRTFGQENGDMYEAEVQSDGKICGHCLWVDIGFCTYASCYPEEIARRVKA